MDLLWGPVVDHGAMYKAAIEQNKPLVVYINTKPREIPGTLGYFTGDFFGRKDAQILVGYPKGGTLYEMPLSSLETDKEIKKQIDKVMQSVKPKIPTPVSGPLHSHECPKCHTVWVHGHDKKGNEAAHTCPNCGLVNYAVHQTNVRQVPTTIQGLEFLAPRQNCPNGQCPYVR